MSRPSKVRYYLDIAAAVAARSTCLRRQYGAVIVKNDMIISTGYNGSARGEPNCCDVGKCWRIAHNIPHGQQFEKCCAIHGEMNAIISASRLDMIGATLYLAGFENGQRLENPQPCEMCQRMIDNAGIETVISRDNAPVVAAKPVAHGRWVEYPECLKYDDALHDTDVACSVCHEVFSVCNNDTERFNYCPNCGAEMGDE